MRDIRKKIVTGEHGEPLAVQIDYADWLEIKRQLEAAKGEDECSLSEIAEAARPYWKEGDGLEFQRRLREEWTRP